MSVAAVSVAFAWAVSLSAAASTGICGWPERIPDAERCRSELAAAQAVAQGGQSAVEALVARADVLRDADDLVAAETALACAAARPGAAGDARVRYMVVRRLGILDYSRSRPVEALGRFECALRLAEGLEDKEEVARQLKNIGSALRRIGDYAGAMRALSRSLTMQREAGDAAVGPVLNNIADVYRDLDQAQEAEGYYRQALEVYRASGDTVKAMHVYDSLSELAMDRRDTRGATTLLQRALADLKSVAEGDASASGARRYQLMIRAGLIRAALAEGDIGSARRHLSDALALADAHRLVLPPELQIEAARTERLEGRRDAAIARLRTAVTATADAPAQQARALHELSLVLEESGRSTEALDMLRRAHVREIEDLQAQRDRGLAWSNARLNLNETRRRLDEAEASSQRRTLQLWLTAVSALAALALVGLLFQRRHQRARQAEAVRRARDEAALARYRREYDALVEDRHLLQALLDSRDDALVLADGDGVVLAANRTACALLAVERDAIVGHALADGFEQASAMVLRSAFERMEDDGDLGLDLRTGPGAARLHAELRQWERGDGKVVLTLKVASDARADATNVPLVSGDAAMQQEAGLTGERNAGHGPVPVAAASTGDAAALPSTTGATNEAAGADPEAVPPPMAQAVPAAAADAGPQRDDFRRELVELMLAVVDAWERSTGHNRIELAERSRIWRVNIDDGRLRARAMERYLSLSKLPLNPRWRDVLRSAYYVLSHCERIPPATRAELERRVDDVLAFTRRDALA